MVLFTDEMPPSSIRLDVLAPDETIKETRILQLKLGEPIRVGRSSSDKTKSLNAAPDNALFDCKVVSRDHALIEASAGLPGPVFVKDTSKYGTYVNSKRITKDVPTKVSTGDRLEFGDTVIHSPDQITHVPVRIRIHFDERDPSPEPIEPSNPLGLGSTLLAKQSLPPSPLSHEMPDATSTTSATSPSKLHIGRSTYTCPSSSSFDDEMDDELGNLFSDRSDAQGDYSSDQDDDSISSTSRRSSREHSVVSDASSGGHEDDVEFTPDQPQQSNPDAISEHLSPKPRPRKSRFDQPYYTTAHLVPDADPEQRSMSPKPRLRRWTRYSDSWDQPSHSNKHNGPGDVQDDSIVKDYQAPSQTQRDERSVLSGAGFRHRFAPHRSQDALGSAVEKPVDSTRVGSSQQQHSKNPVSVEKLERTGPSQSQVKSSGVSDRSGFESSIMTLDGHDCLPTTKPGTSDKPTNAPQRPVLQLGILPRHQFSRYDPLYPSDHGTSTLSKSAAGEIQNDLHQLKPYPLWSPPLVPRWPAYHYPVEVETDRPGDMSYLDPDPAKYRSFPYESSRDNVVTTQTSMGASRVTDPFGTVLRTETGTVANPIMVPGSPFKELSSHNDNPKFDHQDEWRPQPAPDSRLSISNLVNAKPPQDEDDSRSGHKRKADDIEQDEAALVLYNRLMEKFLQSPSSRDYRSELSRAIETDQSKQQSASYTLSSSKDEKSVEPSVDPCVVQTIPDGDLSVIPRPAKRIKSALHAAATATAYAALGSIATIGFLASPIAERLAGL